MSEVDFDLHALRQTDLPTLEALRHSLELAGESAAISRAADLESSPRAPLPPGPLPCRVRILLEGSEAAAGPAAETRVIIEDRALLPEDLGTPSEALTSADLVLVPGPAHALSLGEKCRGEVIATGLARLDALLREPAEERIRARRELGLPGEMKIAAFVPDASSGILNLLADAGPEATVSGWLGLILGNGSAKAVEEQRLLAAHMPGVAFVEPSQWGRGFAAADALIAVAGSVLVEAAALGKGVVIVEAREDRMGATRTDLGPRIRNADELTPALESVLPGSAAAERFRPAQTLCREQLLLSQGNAAARMAAEIQQRFGAHRLEPATVPAAPSAGIGAGAAAETAPEPLSAALPEREFLDAIEARVAFGDVDGALSALQEYLALRPSARAFAVLASIQRREGDSAATSTLQSAEALAREDLGKILCERGRAQVDAGEMGAARAAFEEARQIAPAQADPWVGLGSIALHAQDAGLAERSFREAIDREYSPRVWAGLGMSLVGQGRSQEAISCFESALDLEADNVSAIYGLVQAAFQCGEQSVAERRVCKFVELHSGNLDLLFTLAGLRFQLGNRAGSLEVVERIELFDASYPGLSDLRQKLEA